MNPVKKMFRFTCVATLGLLTLVGCSGATDRDAKTAASALINENKNVVAFGHISVQQMLDKLDYKHLPKAGAILKGELATWESGVDFTKPVYFALEAPFAEDGSPELTYIFMDVKDKDSLTDKFVGMGYEASEEGDITCFSEGDVGIGIRNSLAIILIKGQTDDFKPLLKTAFEQTEGDESEGKTATILENSGDIVTALNIERLYTTANTSLNKLSSSKQKELTEMVADGFIQSETNFEKGKMTVKVSNLFSDKLKDRLFYKEDAGAGILKKLGSGNAWMGMSVNIDMRKMESFIKDYAPDMQKQINNTMPGEAVFAMTMMGDNAFSKILSGQFGFVAVGDPGSALGMEPQFNFFLGLGSEGQMINDQASQYAIAMGLPKEGDAFVAEGVAVAPRKDGLYGFSLNGDGQGGKLKIPSFANKFGKKTFSMFIDFGRMDVESLELEEGAKVLEIMDSFMITVDRNGGEMVLTTKSKSTNILKQVGQFYVREFEDKIGGMSL